MGGVVARSPSDVVFCGAAVAPEARLAVDAPDYTSAFRWPEEELGGVVEVVYWFRT